jgi:hypothetical protein
MLLPDYEGPKQLSSLDLTTRSGKRLLINSQNNPTFSPDALRGKVFRVVNWIAERREFHDETSGDNRLGVSVTLIDPSGKTCRFGSEAVVRVLDTIRTVYGNGPWSEPIFLMIDKYTTKNSRQSYSILEVDPADVAHGQQTW